MWLVKLLLQNLSKRGGTTVILSLSKVSCRLWQWQKSKACVMRHKDHFMKRCGTKGSVWGANVGLVGEGPSSWHSVVYLFVSAFEDDGKSAVTDEVFGIVLEVANTFHVDFVKSILTGQLSLARQRADGLTQWASISDHTTLAKCIAASETSSVYVRELQLRITRFRRRDHRRRVIRSHSDNGE